MEDLVSLFEFLMPGYLPDFLLSGKSGDDPVWRRERIREMTAPYLLRRQKKQVAPELPEKLEQVVFCQMGIRQRALYERVQQAGLAAIERLEYEGASEGRVKLATFTELLRLRQVCADPGVVDPGLDLSDSAKWAALSELLQEALDGGHRMLIFSQFVAVLGRLREQFDAEGIVHTYLDGSTRNRMQEVDRFQADPSVLAFLISLKAGGTGLNLTGADMVVHFDPWWNPAVEAQATDRAHRIGQTRLVTSFKLIVEDSVEERVQSLQQEKRLLLDSLFAASDAHLERISLMDLKNLLKG
jgi:SNF2 family DNA or RNA helicase